MACVALLAWSAPAHAATWQEPNIVGLSGSLAKGTGAWLELPWAVLRTVPDGDPRNVGQFPNGNLLITNRFDKLVREVDAAGSTVWSFGAANLVAPGFSVKEPFGATPLANGNVLITYRRDFAVAEIDRTTRQVVRVLGTPGVAGALGDPFRATELPAGNTLGADVLVADNQTGRAVAMRWDQTVTWQYTSPNGAQVKDARYLPNGNVLITEDVAHVVLEVTPTGYVVWQYGTPGVPGTGPNQLNGPVSAERLADGTTLISDEVSGRVLRVDNAGIIVWEFSASSLLGLSDTGPSSPRHAVPTAKGSLLVVDEGHDRVIEIGRASSGLVTSGQLDCGLPGARKKFSSIAATVDAPAGTGFTIAYSVDGGSFKTLTGTALPASTFGKLIRYRVTLTSTRYDLTPRLTAVSIGYAAAPATSPRTPGTSSGTGGTGGAGTSRRWTGYTPGFGTGTGTATSGTKQGGTGYTSGGTVAVGEALEGALSTQRGWSMASVGTTTMLGAKPGSAGTPAPPLGGLVLLGALYSIGAVSVPLGQLIARLFGRVSAPV